MALLTLTGYRCPVKFAFAPHRLKTKTKIKEARVFSSSKCATNALFSHFRIGNACYGVLTYIPQSIKICYEKGASWEPFCCILFLGISHERVDSSFRTQHFFLSSSCFFLAKVVPLEARNRTSRHDIKIGVFESHSVECHFHLLFSFFLCFTFK